MFAKRTIAQVFAFCRDLAPSASENIGISLHPARDDSVIFRWLRSAAAALMGRLMTPSTANRSHRQNGIATTGVERLRPQIRLNTDDKASPPLLTIFTIPKPFEGHTGIIQRNAIRSWTHLEPKCEIILCGDERGTEAIATELGAVHLHNLSRNELGTPYLDTTFQQVRQLARGRLLCYMNCDLVFLDDFSNAIQRVIAQLEDHPFLMVGQRWDFDQNDLIDFDEPRWRDRLRRQVAQGAKPHSLWGLDYFLFPREGVLDEMPPFVVGRPGWDNWMIYNARRRGVPVIDASPVVKVIHQNHDYNHVPQRSGERWVGPEAQRQVRLVEQLMNGSTVRFAIVDATHRLDENGVLPIRGLRSWRRRWDTLPALYPRLKPLRMVLNPIVVLADLVWSIVRRFRGLECSA